MKDVEYAINLSGTQQNTFRNYEDFKPLGQLLSSYATKFYVKMIKPKNNKGVSFLRIGIVSGMAFVLGIIYNNKDIGHISLTSRSYQRKSRKITRQRTQ